MELDELKNDPFPDKPNMPPSVIQKQKPRRLPRVPRNPIQHGVAKNMKRMLKMFGGGKTNLSRLFNAGEQDSFVWRVTRSNKFDSIAFISHTFVSKNFQNLSYYQE